MMRALWRASEGYRDVFIFVMWLYCSDVHPTGCFIPAVLECTFAKTMAQIWRAAEVKESWWRPRSLSSSFTLHLLFWVFEILHQTAYLQMEKEAQNTLLNKALSVHVNSSSLIIFPNSLSQPIKMSTRVRQLSPMTDNSFLRPHPLSTRHLQLCCFFIFRLSCDDNQGEWKLNALTLNNLQRLLTTSDRRQKNGEKHSCLMGWICGFYLLFPEK